MVTFLFVSDNKGDWVRRSWDLRVEGAGRGTEGERRLDHWVGASGGPGGQGAVSEGGGALTPAQRKDGLMEGLLKERPPHSMWTELATDAGMAGGIPAEETLCVPEQTL